PTPVATARPAASSRSATSSAVRRSSPERSGHRWISRRSSTNGASSSAAAAATAASSTATGTSLGRYGCPCGSGYQSMYRLPVDVPAAGKPASGLTDVERELSSARRGGADTVHQHMTGAAEVLRLLAQPPGRGAADPYFARPDQQDIEGTVPLREPDHRLADHLPRDGGVPHCRVPVPIDPDLAVIRVSGRERATVRERIGRRGAL